MLQGRKGAPVTLKETIAEAIRTEPKTTFTSAEIIESVQQLIPSANPGSIRTCIRRDLVKDGLVEKFSRTLWRRPVDPKPEPGTTTLSSVKLGESVIDYVEDLKRQIEQWKIKASDLEIKLKNNEKDWKTVLKGKDETIQRLNQRISAKNRNFTFNPPKVR